MTDPLANPATRTATIRRGLLSLLPALGILALLAVTLEGTLQWCMPELGQRRFDARFTGSRPVGANRIGTRGEIPPTDSATPVFMALGDSTTWGTGVGVGDLWSSRLADLLPKERPTRSLMVARPAADLRELRVAFDELAKGRRIDVAVVALCGNMVSLASIRADREAASLLSEAPPAPPPKPGVIDSLKYLPKDSALVGGIIQTAEMLGYLTGVNHHRLEPGSPYGALLAHGWTQAGLDPADAELAWSRFERDLASLKATCDRRGVPLVATWMPSRFTVSNEFRDNLKFVPQERLSIDANERCREVCERLGIPFGDTLKEMRRHRQVDPTAPLYVPSDYTHLDPNGHGCVARAVAPLVANTLEGDPMTERRSPTLPDAESPTSRVTATEDARGAD